MGFFRRIRSVAGGNFNSCVSSSGFYSQETVSATNLVRVFLGVGMRLVHAILFILVAGIAGCSRVHTDVSSFSSVSPLSVGDTFYVLADDGQKGSMEFEQYASSVARRIGKAGWSRVDDIKDATYVVLMSYGIGGSMEVSTPIIGQTGGGTTSHSGTVYGSGGGFGSYSGTSYTAPSYGVVGMASSTAYSRFFALKVVRQSDGKPVYETKASSEGSSATFGQVAECIFDSALSEFPAPQTGTDVRMMRGCGDE